MRRSTAASSGAKPQPHELSYQPTPLWAWDEKRFAGSRNTWLLPVDFDGAQK